MNQESRKRKVERVPQRVVMGPINIPVFLIDLYV
jgi:hypothetical protein